MDDLELDYETFSAVSLPDVGGSVYSSHPTTEILMCAYSLNNGPIRQWVPAEGERIPAELKEALASPDVTKWAWNAAFEMGITKSLIQPIDVRQWRCVMVHAMHCSLPGKLEKAAEVVGLPEAQQKDRKGKALMRKFSFPRRPTKKNPSIRNMPWDAIDEWEAYKSYNIQDVVAEAAIKRRLKNFAMPDDEWELYWLDQTINNAGLPINRAMVQNAIRVYEHAVELTVARLKELTGCDNPNSQPQFLSWAQYQGYPYHDLQKGHVSTAIDAFKIKPDHWEVEAWEEYRANEDLKEALELRREVSRTSITKYYALQRATDEDGNLRHVLQMNGAARTGRFAGRIYQPQNLPRPEKDLEEVQPELAKAIETLDYRGIKLIFGNVFNALASALRPTAQAPEGMMFADADLNAIENRVLGWLAGCDKILEVFRLKQDPYIAFACSLYHQDYETLWHEYKVLKKGEKRKIAKPGTLGCGYGMGPGSKRVNPLTGEIEASGLLQYAWDMGVKDFTEENAKHSVDTFRREFSEVVDYWYGIERAAKKCLQKRQPVRFGVVTFDVLGPFMRMILPSGRPLYYLRPRLEAVRTPWGEERMQITYEGMNERKQWTRISTTGGKLTENADQAISRDLLVHGMKLAAARGLDIRLHVHDQILALVPEHVAKEKTDLLVECMEVVPDWAEGLPLGSVGVASKYFLKD